MTAIIAFFTTTRIGRTLAQIGAVALAILTFGAWSRRKGARENQAKTDAANARETIKAHEGRTDVEADVARGGNARDRLHAGWKR